MTTDHFNRIVNACRELIAAHERRNPAYLSLTLNERAAAAVLKQALDAAQGDRS